MEQVTIDQRFNGPPSSANGGYAAGVAAGLVGGTVTSTLRQPPPIGASLAVHRRGDGGVELRDGDVLIVEATPGALDLEVPPPVSLAASRDAATRYPSFELHPFPTCFVCGPQRDDGLAIFPGPVAGRDDGVWAAPWVPGTDLGDDDVDERVVWAALDCPSYFAIGHGEVLAVLGRLTASLERPVQADQPHIAIAWPIDRDGRKLTSGSAVLTEDGSVCAYARATWIEIEQPLT